MRRQAIRDHDERAAVTCALTALAVAAESAVGVGDPEDGDIFLPPSTIWGASLSGGLPWIESALLKDVAGVRASTLGGDGNCAARVRFHSAYWFYGTSGPPGIIIDVYTQLAYDWISVEFIEAPLFTQLLPDYLAEEDYMALQLFLVRDPEAGDVITGTGGFRKLRWADPRRGKGKRGGLRVIYHHFVGDNQIWFVTLYGKDEMEDLRPGERRTLKAAIEEEAGRRALRRRARRK